MYWHKRHFLLHSMISGQFDILRPKSIKPNPCLFISFSLFWMFHLAGFSPTWLYLAQGLFICLLRSQNGPTPPSGRVCIMTRVKQGSCSAIYGFSPLWVDLTLLVQNFIFMSNKYLFDTLSWYLLFRVRPCCIISWVCSSITWCTIWLSFRS